MKRGNARGAKGAGHPRQDGVNGQPEELLVLAEAGRLPWGGTSRMNREVHVRICGGLGVKFPGSTRQLRRPTRPHISGKDRNGKYALKRKTIAKRWRAKLQEIKQELRRRMHDPVLQTGKWLRSVVQGYFNYHAVPGNNV
jgi:hypothetical protein